MKIMKSEDTALIFSTFCKSFFHSVLIKHEKNACVLISVIIFHPLDLIFGHGVKCSQLNNSCALTLFGMKIIIIDFPHRITANQFYANVEFWLHTLKP